jgi:molybdopterin molybdotransferase
MKSAVQARGVRLVHHIEQYTGVDDALWRVREKLRPDQRVQIIQAKDSLGRVSAVDVVSPAAVPPFPTSHMDGFAVRSEDIKGASQAAPVTLRVTGEVRLGAETRRSVGNGEAFRVATGSRVPSGADTVVPAEHARVDGRVIVVTSAQESGRWVYKAGADVRKGERVLAKGDVIRAQQMGLMLGLGLTRVRVRERPKVAVIATGSELTDASSPRPGKVRDSHSPYVVSLVRALGAAPVDMGIVKDDQPEVTRTIRRALQRSDFVITLGGTSVGRADVVGEAILSMKPDLMIHGVKMDRGRVAGVAVVGGKPVLMMPGPIQGAMNAFVLFAVQIIGSLEGSMGRRLELQCRLGENWEARKRFPDFTKVVYVRLDSGHGIAEPLVGETESIKVLSEADGYVVVPESVTRLEKGSTVVVKLLPGFSFA